MRASKKQAQRGSTATSNIGYDAQATDLPSRSLAQINDAIPGFDSGRFAYGNY